MNNDEIINKISIIYDEFINLYKNILEKNNENILPTYTFLDYSTRMKIRNKEDREVFERVEYLFLNSRESKIDILESLMDLYEQIKGKYYEA
ncbi:MAG: hypothetical protein ACLU33_05875 [Christensenellales bacterium]